MQPKELNERSPLRVLEQSTRGGLGAGKVGAVVSRTGVGKTAFLVGVALDDLMRGRKVLPVSLDHPVDKVTVYYDEIFADLCHEKDLADVWKVRLEMERNRRIHHYRDGFSPDKLKEALAFNRQHSDFAPSAILIDDYALEDASTDELAALRELAKSAEAELWISGTVHREDAVDERGIPEPAARVADAFDIILRMAHDGKAVHIGLLKDHDSPKVSDLKLALDPKTMLLIKE